MARLPQIGLDLGSATIKVAALSPLASGRWQLVTAASMPAATGETWEKVGVDAAAATVVKLLREAGVKFKSTVMAVPQDQVSMQLVKLPLMTNAEIDQALSWQVEQYLPLPKSEAVWSWEVVKRDTVAAELEVALTAIPRARAIWYRQVMERSGLEPAALEPELSAISRSTVDAAAGLTLVVDIGAKATDMGIVRSGQLLVARAVPTAGEAFTRAIATALGLDVTVAHQYQATYGLDQKQLGGKLTEAMRPVVTILATEMKKTLDFYGEKHVGEAVKTVVIAGGVAAMPGIVAELSARLGLEVTVGDPFRQVVLDEKQKQTLGAEGPFYATVVGLAMKEV